MEGKYYSVLFRLAKTNSNNEEEELTLIDFTIQTINVNRTNRVFRNQVFKNIRHRLNVSDEKY